MCIRFEGLAKIFTISDIIFLHPKSHFLQLSHSLKKKKKKQPSSNASTESVCGVLRFLHDHVTLDNFIHWYGVAPELGLKTMLQVCGVWIHTGVQVQYGALRDYSIRWCGSASFMRKWYLDRSVCIACLKVSFFCLK